MAVLNDSTGTLMSCAHRRQDCRIGIIIGKQYSKFFQNKFASKWNSQFIRAAFLHTLDDKITEGI